MTKVGFIPVAPEINLEGSLLISSANTGNQWYLEGMATGIPIWKQEKASSNGTRIIPVNLGVVPNGAYLVSLRNSTTKITRKVFIMK